MDLLKDTQGIEYTEAIRHTLNEKAEREMIIGQRGNFYQASILCASGGPVESAPGHTIEEALTRVFTAGQPAWYREAITFHNEHSLQHMQTLVESYGQIRFKLQYDKVLIYLGTDEDPIDGDYGHIQEVLRYAITHLKETGNN